MAVDYGQNIVAPFTQVDNALNLPAATPNTSGTSYDVGANTNPQAVVLRGYINVVNPNGIPADGYDIDIRVQFSPDNANWPDAGLGHPLGNWYSAVVGAGITRSQHIEIPVKDRYARLQIDNNNPVDNLTFNSYVKIVLMQAG
jgi:hypothetical protein